MKPIKVAFLHHKLLLGGAERVSYNVALYFHKFGIHTTFIAQSQNKAQWTPPESSLCDIFILPNKKAMFGVENIRTLTEEVAKRAIEIIFIAPPMPDIPPILGQILSCKLVYWHHSSPFWELTNKIERSRLRAKDSWYYYLEWHLHAKIKYQYLSGYKNRLYRKYINNVERYDAYIVLCEGYREEMIQRLSLNNSQSQKIYPIINTQEVNPSPQVDKENLIVYAGRLSRPDKRIDRLLRSWAKIQEQLPTWRMEIHGVGPDEVRLHRLAKKLKLNRLYFCGYNNNMQSMYDKAAVLCLTSTFEGWGLVLTEAQNNAVVPIAFNCSRGVETIISGGEEGGILIPSFDLDQYANELLHICLDANKRNQLQQAVLKKRLSYLPDVNIPVWDQLFTQLIGRSPFAPIKIAQQT